MLEASRQAILASLHPLALVLDVGGGAQPFARADWVIDIMPYERRGLYGYTIDPAEERFDQHTWIVRDICDHDPWPFADKQFDFVVCSHTLEDVRDPVWVCDEMIRVAKAGYIEVPSRLEEQSYGFQGPWVGWGHHRWLIDIEDDEIRFVFKHHVVHGRDSDHFGAGFQPTLSPEQRVSRLQWEDTFRHREQVMLDPGTLDRYLADFVSAHRSPREPTPRHALGRLRRLLRPLRPR